MSSPIKPGDVFLTAEGEVCEIERVWTEDGRGHYRIVNNATGKRYQLTHTELISQYHSNNLFLIETRDLD